MKVLVVEDTRTARVVVCSQLERMGMQPLPAGDGLEAVALFQQERPDLVLLDLILPGIDGFEVARRLRQLEGQGEWTPIIFLTASYTDDHLEKGIAAGGDDFLGKPVSEVVLRAKLRAMQRIVQMRRSLVVLTRKLDAANQELERLSSIDGLTGVANRRRFDTALEAEWRRAQRHHRVLALVICDVDFFKKFNDALGHQAGDDCLQQVAATMSRAMERAGDLLARYGGEEFAMILPETTLGGAAFVAERMRHSVEQLKLVHPDSPLGHVTLSCGVAACVPGAEATPADLIAAADRALYNAKDSGRNRVARIEGLLLEPAC